MAVLGSPSVRSLWTWSNFKLERQSSSAAEFCSLVSRCILVPFCLQGEDHDSAGDHQCHALAADGAAACRPQDSQSAPAPLSFPSAFVSLFTAVQGVTSPQQVARGGGGRSWNCRRRFWRWKWGCGRGWGKCEWGLGGKSNFGGDFLPQVNCESEWTGYWLHYDADTHMTHTKS